jgi:hypothetical protein
LEEIFTLGNGPTYKKEWGNFALKVIAQNKKLGTDY